MPIKYVKHMSPSPPPLLHIIAKSRLFPRSFVGRAIRFTLVVTILCVHYSSQTTTQRFHPRCIARKVLFFIIKCSESIKRTRFNSNDKDSASTSHVPGRVGKTPVDLRGLALGQYSSPRRSFSSM